MKWGKMKKKYIDLLNTWTWTISSSVMYTTMYIGFIPTPLCVVFAQRLHEGRCMLHGFPRPFSAKLSPYSSMSPLLDGEQTVAPLTGVHSPVQHHDYLASYLYLKNFPYYEIFGNNVLHKVGNCLLKVSTEAT